MGRFQRWKQESPDYEKKTKGKTTNQFLEVRINRFSVTETVDNNKILEKILQIGNLGLIAVSKIVSIARDESI